MESFSEMPSTKRTEPFNLSILDSGMVFGDSEGISKIADYVYILEKNCDGIFGEEQKMKEWEQFLFRLTYYIYLKTGTVYNFEESDTAKEEFEYYWNIAVAKQQCEQNDRQESKEQPLINETENRDDNSSSASSSSLEVEVQNVEGDVSSVVKTVFLIIIMGMLLYVSPTMPIVAWVGFALLVCYFLSQNFCRNNNKRKMTKSSESDVKAKSSEEVVNAYIRLISCSICYKNADPSTHKTEMKQFGCRHAICTSCSLELIRHHWNDRSENRPAFRCPMCCKPSRTEPLGLHYL